MGGFLRGFLFRRNIYSYMGKEHGHDFKLLGVRLKRLRQKRQENLAEVAGAVEIDIEELAKIEQGGLRPSEDILLLLISHFGAKEDEATKLWELAGYDQSQIPAANIINDDYADPKPMVMVMPIDARIVYTDMVHVMVNNYGVVMNFMQRSGPNDQPLAVTRIGMSREHAESVVSVIQQALAQAKATPQTKALPAPQPKPKDKK